MSEGSVCVYIELQKGDFPSNDPGLVGETESSQPGPKKGISLS